MPTATADRHRPLRARPSSRPGASAGFDTGPAHHRSHLQRADGVRLARALERAGAGQRAAPGLGPQRRRQDRGQLSRRRSRRCLPPPRCVRGSRAAPFARPRLRPGGRPGGVSARRCRRRSRSRPPRRPRSRTRSRTRSSSHRGPAARTCAVSRRTSARPSSNWRRRRRPRSGSASPAPSKPARWRSSGCFKATHRIADIPAAERGIVRGHRVGVAGAERCRPRTLSTRTALGGFDGFVSVGGTLTINGAELTPGPKASLVIYTQANKIVSSDAALAVAGIALAEAARHRSRSTRRRTRTARSRWGRSCGRPARTTSACCRWTGSSVQPRCRCARRPRPDLDQLKLPSFFSLGGNDPAFARVTLSVTAAGGSRSTNYT